MPRPFVFPDPNDRSPNNPSVIVSSPQILGIYKHYTGESMERVTKKVQDWFCTEATKKYSWDDSVFHGNQCVLSVSVERRTIPDE